MKITDAPVSNSAKIVLRALVESIGSDIEFLCDSKSTFMGYNMDNNYYTINVPLSQNQNEFDDSVLHEVYHILQVKLGYPRLTAKNDEAISSFCSYVNSFFLDIDVNCFLEQVGFHYKEKYITEYKKLSEDLELACKNKNVNMSFYEAVFNAFHCVFVKLYLSDFLYSKLMKKADKVNIQIRETSEFLLKLLENKKELDVGKYSKMLYDFGNYLKLPLSLENYYPN